MSYALLADPRVTRPAGYDLVEAEENAWLAKWRPVSKRGQLDCGLFELSVNVCRRCGLCDNLVARVCHFWLFRAGDIALLRSMSFEITVEFFHFPQSEPPTCTLPEQTATVHLESIFWKLNCFTLKWSICENASGTLFLCWAIIGDELRARSYSVTSVGTPL
jgi:hypothetical protein